MPPSLPRIPARQALRLFVAAALGAYGLARFSNPEHWDLLDDVNLAVHEAGHVFFGPLGDQISALGGSLLQVLVPAVFVAYFLVRQRDTFAASVIMGWLGASLGNVARYIGDARAQELPLLGGENVIHDWWYLLTEWDMLASDLVIARYVRLASALAFLLAVGGAAWSAREKTPWVSMGAIRRRFS